MNNTEKLLRAFIEAQGYEIEEYETGEFRNGAYGMGPNGTGDFQQIPITDYKVTKRSVDEFHKIFHETPNQDVKELCRAVLDEFDKVSRNENT